MAARIILSVEDDDAVFHLLEVAFEGVAEDIELHRARDGDEALFILHEANKSKPDLILLNLNLPKRTGFELLEEMKKDGLAESIPAVVFSSSSLNSEKARCLALGAKHYFVKPDTFDGYVSTIQSLCALLR